MKYFSHFLTKYFQQQQQDNVSHSSVSCVHRQQQPSSNTGSLRSGSVQSVSTVGVSEVTESQTPSCRALAGSLASFDCPSDHIIGNEGVPLLLPEETELESNNVSRSQSVTLLSVISLSGLGTRRNDERLQSGEHKVKIIINLNVNYINLQNITTTRTITTSTTDSPRISCICLNVNYLLYHKVLVLFCCTLIQYRILYYIEYYYIASLFIFLENVNSI